MTSKEPRWVPRLVVEATHLDQIREHGGLIGIRDENALEAALARPQQRRSYEPDTDLPRLAAAYAFGLSSNHPFRDGNKRIAFLTAAIFLRLNGLEVTVSEPDVVRQMFALAAGDLSEEQLADWFRENSRLA